MLLGVNLTIRFERKKNSASATVRLDDVFVQAKKKIDRLPTRSPLQPLRDVDQAGFRQLKTPISTPFVDKLLNIHRIECAELPNKATANFLSSFCPVQKQGLFKRFQRT
jgi:hypothetical protein